MIVLIYANKKTGETEIDNIEYDLRKEITLFDINIFGGESYGISTTTKIMTSNYGRLTIFKDNLKNDWYYFKTLLIYIQINGRFCKNE